MSHVPEVSALVMSSFNKTTETRLLHKPLKKNMKIEEITVCSKSTRQDKVALQYWWTHVLEVSPLVMTNCNKTMETQLLHKPLKKNMKIKEITVCSKSTRQVKVALLYWWTHVLEVSPLVMNSINKTMETHLIHKP